GYELAAQAVEHLLPMPGLPYFSHEVLHLDYETALTRLLGEEYYNLATHLPWVGMRTCALDSAHVEYVRGLANPVAVKISAAVDEEA
ncbi:3-deoxy-7-phosphoheptulonate synthase, partial [bacterium LRH843]|nr:3-deoxy-7-phosphoheptulonate synthase [bacterium LRH843]